MLTALPDFPNDIGRLSLIPLRVHMDEGKWTGRAKNRVIMVCSISGMAHTPRPFESRLLFSVMPIFCIIKLESGTRQTKHLNFCGGLQSGVWHSCG